MVIAWLYNVIDKRIHDSVTYAETANQIRTDLKEIYSQGNEIRIHQLRREITIADQGTISVSVYFTKLKTLWDELDAYLQMPHCKGVKDFSLFKYQESERAYQFLTGLDVSCFGVLRSNILSIEPLPNLNKVYSIVLREERQQNLSPDMELSHPTEAAVFKAKAAARTQSGNRPKCAHCQKLGHKKSRRFELIGYPPNWQNR